MPLRALLITQSPRFDMEVATTLASSCPNLTVLRLAEVGQLTDAMLPALSSLNQLTHLDLSSPGAPFTDDAVTELLASIGSKLVTLNLSQTGLTDDVLPAIAKCSALQHLYLNDLDLSDNASAALLLGLSPGLVTIELGQAHKLKEKALSGLLKHSRSLHHVNISGWKDVDATSISKLKECNALVTLDIGWCREVTDFTLKDILDSCSQIELIRVWGEFGTCSMVCILMARLQPAHRRCAPQEGSASRRYRNSRHLRVVIDTRTLWFFFFVCDSKPFPCSYFDNVERSCHLL